MNASWQVSLAIGTFNNFYYESLGITLDQLGKIGAMVNLIVMILLYPAGILSDKYHPLRVMKASMIAMMVLTPFGFIYLFHDFSPKTVWYLVIAQNCVSLPIGLMYAAASLPMYMKLLPKDRYGQFGSADAMVRSIATIVVGGMAGLFLDVFKWIHGGDSFYYRYIPVWSLFFQIVTNVFMYLLYRGWKEHGGAENYVPPDTDVNRQMKIAAK
jgi:MFS family permease